MKRIIALVITASIMLCGCSLSFTTAGSEAEKETADRAETMRTSFSDAEEFESDHAYVYHGSDIEKDLRNGDFELCPLFDNSFVEEAKTAAGQREAASSDVLWYSSAESDLIPTVDAAKGDKLLYMTMTRSDMSDITLYRMYDNGFSIGLSNMAFDAGSHVYVPIDYTEEKMSDTEVYVAPNSDVSAILDLEAEVFMLYLDKVGDKAVTASDLTPGGVLTGLTRDKEYKATFYTGSVYQDFLLKADERIFTGYEIFKSTDYRFFHSTVIEIILPEYLKSGYYLINYVGLFRYIAPGDTKDSEVNDPVIIYDEDGTMIFDPTEAGGDVGEGLDEKVEVVGEQNDKE